MGCVFELNSATSLSWRGCWVGWMRKRRGERKRASSVEERMLDFRAKDFFGASRQPLVIAPSNTRGACDSLCAPSPLHLPVRGTMDAVPSGRVGFVAADVYDEGRKGQRVYQQSV